VGSRDWWREERIDYKEAPGTFCNDGNNIKFDYSND
jgi:hypothetical protein